MSEPQLTRRGMLRAGTATAVGAGAVAATGSAAAQSDYGGWLSNVGNYDGTVVDETDSDSVTIEVGADGNGGPYAYGPPAVKITPGTEVTFEWVQGTHNVIDDGGSFESKLTGESGFTFTYTPEETGVIKYFCRPHKAMGMKGVLDVVGSGGGSGGGGSGGSSDSGGGGDGSSGGVEAQNPADSMGSSGDGGVGGMVVGALVLAFVSPALFAAFLRNEDLSPDEGER